MYLCAKSAKIYRNPINFLDRNCAPLLLAGLIRVSHRDFIDLAREIQQSISELQTIRHRGVPEVNHPIDIVSDGRQHHQVEREGAHNVSHQQILSICFFVICYVLFQFHRKVINIVPYAIVQQRQAIFVLDGHVNLPNGY